MREMGLKKGLSAASKKAAKEAKIEAKAEKAAAAIPANVKPVKHEADVLSQTAGTGDGSFKAGVPYVVRQGCVITSKVGVLSGGMDVKPEWLPGGIEAMRRLVEVTGLVVRKGE